MDVWKYEIISHVEHEHEHEYILLVRFGHS